MTLRRHRHRPLRTRRYDAEPHPTIDGFYNFATGKISPPVLTLDERPARLRPSLSATADGGPRLASPSTTAKASSR